MTTSVEGADELAVPLDLLLTSSAIGIGKRMLPNTSWTRLALNLARKPRTVADRVGSLGSELTDIALGRSERTPPRSDRRFDDSGWQSNPLFKRTMQAYLATTDTVTALFEDADMDWRDAEWMRFVLNNLMEGLSPSNSPLLNPLAWKALVDTGGRSAVLGLRHFLADISEPPRIPSMVAPGAFAIGENIAVTAGSVVLRTDLFELIHYAPQTERVRSVPLLMVPPVINKYYIMDISPGRSMIEYFLQSGQQVFAISWRNPTVAHRDQGMDSYGRAIIEALDAVERTTGSDRTHLQGSCSGGMVAAMVAAHLTAVDQGHRLASLTLMVTVLDHSRAGFAIAAIDEDIAKIVIALSARKGYLDGRSLAEVFAWLRPTDLVWRYWVNNYLQGRTPQPFDVLFWNSDATRMTAALHRELVLMGVHNSLALPDQVTMLDTPVDLSQLTLDTYVVAGITDHISPWQACYRSARLLGSKDLRFALSTSGHIAALVNPPGNPKASYRADSADHADPAAWVNAVPTRPGTWWPDFVEWLAERSGPDKNAPIELGTAHLRPIAPAPGAYVLEQ